jgi:flagellar biosynthesis/type III secretory pathway M-ring protein FliF/YscJ
MNENKQSSSNHDLQDHIEAEHNHLPKWKRVHHTWWFWIFLVLMLGGILYYVMTVDFAFAPRKQMEQNWGNNRTP